MRDMIYLFDGSIIDIMLVIPFSIKYSPETGMKKYWIPAFCGPYGACLILGGWDFFIPMKLGYPLVNLWKITILLMGHFTINSHFQ